MIKMEILLDFQKNFQRRSLIRVLCCKTQEEFMEYNGLSYRLTRFFLIFETRDWQMSIVEVGQR